MVPAKNRADDTLPCTSTRTGAVAGPDRSTFVRNRDVDISAASTPAGRVAADMWSPFYGLRPTPARNQTLLGSSGTSAGESGRHCGR